MQARVSQRASWHGDGDGGDTRDAKGTYGRAHCIRRVDVDTAVEQRADLRVVAVLSCIAQRFAILSNQSNAGDMSMRSSTLGPANGLPCGHTC